MIIRIILLIVIFLNILLGTLVLIQDDKLSSNRLFFLMSILAAIWTFTNYMISISTSLFWLESSYALGALLISSGFIWILLITNYYFTLSKILLIYVIAIFFSIDSYVPGFISQTSARTYLETIFSGNIGLGFILYTIFYITTSFLIIFRLHTFYKRSREQKIKSQIRYILYGSFITLAMTALSSFLLPYFSIFLFGTVDSIGFLLFLTSITYAITKHRLFNIKIIAVELITCSLWTFILIRVCIAKDMREFWTEIILFLITLILGILLIKTTIYEIDQRKKIVELTRNLRDSYNSKISL